MTSSIDDFDGSHVDEKAAVRPHEVSSDLGPRDSHHESAEELHESEQDIPVRYTDSSSVAEQAMCLNSR